MPEALEKFEVDGVEITLGVRQDGYHTVTLARGTAAIAYVVSDTSSVEDLRYVMERQATLFTKVFPKMLARMALRKIGMIK